MTTQEITAKMNTYFDMEYQQTKRLLGNPPSWVDSVREVKNSTLQRCLGITFFVQELGVPFNQIEASYEEFRKKIEDL